MVLPSLWLLKFLTDCWFRYPGPREDMKLPWTLLVAAAVLVAGTSSASIDKRSGPNKPELRWLFDDFWKYVNQMTEAATATWARVRDFFNNIRDTFSRTNAKAKECLEKFEKEFKAAANSDELKNQGQYAAYMKQVGQNTANAKDISEFEKFMKNLRNSYRNARGELKAFIQKVEALTKARVRCTLEAIRDANNGRGMTTASSLTEDASRGVADGTTSDSGRDTNTEDATDSGTESATNDDTNRATDSGTESVTNDDTNRATDSGTESATNDDTNRATDSGTEGATNDDTNRATDSDTESATNDDTNRATDSGTETATNDDTNSVSKAVDGVTDANTV